MECRRCIHWQDESLVRAEAQRQANESPEFYGCRIHDSVETTRKDCPDYQASQDLFAICSACGIPVPKVCLSLGECTNCTDTDLYCVEHCRGEEEKTFCTHFQRLRSTGYTLVEEGQVFELYPPASAGTGTGSEPPLPVVDLFDESGPEDPEP